MTWAPPAIPPCNAIQPGMTAHHFQNHDAFVTRCGGVQTVARISDCGDCRIETERARGGFKIVVDRFRNANAIDARFLQLQRSGHGAVAADDDQRFDAILFQNATRIGDHFGVDDGAFTGADLRGKMSAICRADDCSAARHDAAGATTIEDDKISRRQETFEAVAKAENFEIQFFRGECDAAQARHLVRDSRHRSSERRCEALSF